MVALFAGERTPRRAAEIPGVVVIPGSEGATPGKDQEQEVSGVKSPSHLINNEFERNFSS